MKKKYLTIIFLLFTLCTQKPTGFHEIISLDLEKKGDFNVLFEKQAEYILPTKYQNNIDLFKIAKIIEKNNGNLLISEPENSFILEISKTGELIKVIGGVGNGPGEFGLLSDFIYTFDKKIYALDFLQSAVNIFDDGEFKKKIRLSYEHRAPEQILMCSNNTFIICANKNLTIGSTSDNYGFLEFNEYNYLNKYNESLEYNFSYLTPNDKFNKTHDVFMSPQISTFSPSAIYEDFIITMLQDGLYNIYISNNSGKILKEYAVHQNSFVEFDFGLISDHKIINSRTNYDLERQGKVIASHSSPISIHVLGNYVLVTIISPYDNYFPQFSKIGNLEYHVDIYKFYKKELLPVVGGIKMNQIIVGVAKDNSILTVKNTYSEEPRSIKISKYKLNLLKN